MQTFVPETTFRLIALALDPKRLFKQAVETKQIFLALTQAGYGWQHHPAVHMWRGHEGALLRYGTEMVYEHIRRGGNSPQLLPWYESTLELVHDGPAPWWWGDDRIHSSHRAALHRKAPELYPQWRNEPDVDYWWPTRYVNQ